MKEEEILQQLKEGKIKLYSLDKILGSNKATEIRRKFIEETSGVQCPQIAKSSFDFDKVCGKNAENTIGAAQIPMGIIGPLRVRGDHANGDFYVPMATSEGALIASTNRGSNVITQSGGSFAAVVGDRMTRAPLFKVPDLDHSRTLANWAKENFDDIRRVSDAETRFTKLEGFRPYFAGRNLFLRFEFSTGDSMAMNSATKASDAIASFIEDTFPWARLVSVSGNMCVDKKPSAINLVLGRGKSIVAESLIPRELVRDKLKTTANKMAEVCYRKRYVGSAMAGSLGGFNAHFANISAAFFAATGQDLAHVVEASNGLTMMEETDGDLYASVTLPDVLFEDLRTKLDDYVSYQEDGVKEEIADRDAAAVFKNNVRAKGEKLMRKLKHRAFSLWGDDDPRLWEIGLVPKSSIGTPSEPEPEPVEFTATVTRVDVGEWDFWCSKPEGVEDAKIELLLLPDGPKIVLTEHMLVEEGKFVPQRQNGIGPGSYKAIFTALDGSGVQVGDVVAVEFTEA